MRLLLFIFLFSVWDVAFALDREDCIENGGDWFCRQVEIGDWKYNVGHSHMTDFPYVMAADCRTRDGEWLGQFGGGCRGAIDRDVNNLADFAKRFFEGLPGSEENANCVVTEGSWGYSFEGEGGLYMGPYITQGF